MNPFAAAIAAAAEGTPMSNGSVPEKPGRLLLADGDGLAYYCSGNDETAPGQARINLLEKLRGARGACGAERVKILLTAQDSHKGFRYAIARAKPYQGKRTDTRRPNNWQYLRGLLEEGDLADWIDVETTRVAEADDLFARYAKNHPDCVIYTQDKDMRMVPGWHLDWLTHLLFKLEPDVFRVVHNEKLWGRAWFWSQMFHGDDVDNIPGLPFYKDGSLVKSGPNEGQVKEIRCGEKSDVIKVMLPECKSDMQALLLAQKLYRSCYGDRWLVSLLEQGMLLWMRSDEGSSPFDVIRYGHPLAPLASHRDYPAAKGEILKRIAESLVHEETEGVRSGTNESEPVPEAEREVCALLATDEPDGASAGSRPLDGGGESSAAPGMQQPTREGGEQLPPIRRPQPAGVPAWSAWVLAKA
jgi:hypothetical protein